MKMSDIRIPVLLKELKRSLHVSISVSSEAVTGVCWKVAKCGPLSLEKGNCVAKVVIFHFLAFKTVFLISPVLSAFQGMVYLTNLKKPPTLRKLTCLGNKA